jgi:hypothetical protein
VLADDGDRLIDLGTLSVGELGDVTVDPADEPADAGDLFLGWAGVASVRAQSSTPSIAAARRSRVRRRSSR